MSLTIKQIFDMIENDVHNKSLQAIELTGVVARISYKSGYDIAEICDGSTDRTIKCVYSAYSINDFKDVNNRKINLRSDVKITGKYVNKIRYYDIENVIKISRIELLD